MHAGEDIQLFFSLSCSSAEGGGVFGLGLVNKLAMTLVKRGKLLTDST